MGFFSGTGHISRFTVLPSPFTTRKITKLVEGVGAGRGGDLGSINIRLDVNITLDEHHPTSIYLVGLNRPVNVGTTCTVKECFKRQCYT